MYFSKKRWLNLYGGMVIILAVLLMAGASWSSDDDYMDSYTGGDADEVGTDKCVMCHADKKAGDDATHVNIFEDEENENFGFGCEGCHGPGGNHNSKLEGILQPTKMSQDDVTALCTECHVELGKFKLEKWEESTHNGAGNTCVGCHSGHSTEASFLVKPAADLCAGCHEEKGTDVAEGKHGAAEMACTACHNPHN